MSRYWCGRDGVRVGQSGCEGLSEGVSVGEAEVSGRIRLISVD